MQITDEMVTRFINDRASVSMDCVCGFVCGFCARTILQLAAAILSEKVDTTADKNPDTSADVQVK